ncbi:hypothetical protein M0811_05180 [Anaeramoeba ignava]|uniref:Uncharacterized protein n=1 Tax=Anaeramoeba ignava TaxID=1746090 RepID=A0A9Q0LSU8_ANAIG|nr:hypothetical protein M0811_05180 [Anaeramoeba ignava]
MEKGKCDACKKDTEVFPCWCYGKDGDNHQFQARFCRDCLEKQTCPYCSYKFTFPVVFSQIRKQILRQTYPGYDEKPEESRSSIMNDDEFFSLNLNQLCDCIQRRFDN